MSGRRTRLEGWNTEELERSWWKRGYDPIGRHTMVATVLGVLLAALIGATLDPLDLRSREDLRRAETAAYEESYAAIESSGYTAGVPYGEVEWMGAEIVGGAGADSAYGEQFAVGWRAGWNEALRALRESAESAGLPADYTEFRILDELAER